MKGAVRRAADGSAARGAERRASYRDGDVSRARCDTRPARCDVTRGQRVLAARSWRPVVPSWIARPSSSSTRTSASASASRSPHGHHQRFAPIDDDVAEAEDVGAHDRRLARHRLEQRDAERRLRRRAGVDGAVRVVARTPLEHGADERDVLVAAAPACSSARAAVRRRRRRAAPRGRVPALHACGTNRSASLSPLRGSKRPRKRIVGTSLSHARRRRRRSDGRRRCRCRSG